MPQSPRFANLDALRGLCALTVVLFHCEGLFRNGVIFCHGFLAVDVFFVLSGFVIAHTYEDRLASGALGFGVFVRTRLKRLAPVYWAGTLLGAVMLSVVASYKAPGAFYSPGQIAGLSLMALALIPQLTLGGLAFPANAVAWSLLGEAIANLVYARWLQARRTPVLVALVVAGWSACALYSYAGSLGWCWGGGAADVAMIPLRAIPAFLMGVVLLRAHRAGLLDRLPRLSPLIPLMLWLAIAEVPSFGGTPTFDLLVVAIASPLLIALLVRAPQGVPRPLLWLGAVSYPLYASHLALVFVARNTPLFGFEHGPNPLGALALVAAALALAWLLHRLVETAPWSKAKPAGSFAA